MCAVSLFSAQYSVGSAVIAHCSSSERYAIIYTVNSFASLGLATIVQAVASSQDLDTNAYYYIASAEQFFLSFVFFFSLLYLLFSAVFTRKAPYALSIQAQGEDTRPVVY